MTMFRPHLLFALALAIGMAAAGAVCATAPAAASSTAAPVPDKSPMMSRDEVTRILANNRRIVSPDGIDEKIKVHINGIDQWLSIRGKDRRNPILLFLHGGPASPAMPEAYTFQTPWEDYFTVVQWDQRGAGKTYAANTEQAMAPEFTMGLNGRLSALKRMELKASPLGSTPIASATRSGPNFSNASAKTKALEMDWMVNGTLASPAS